MTHLIYVPFTGLGLYRGFRGNRWLRNRITVFKRFVVPSLLVQTTQDFTLWVSWRREERTNAQVIELKNYLDEQFPGRVFFTFEGLCFWDDKYEDAIAYDRLLSALQRSMPDLVNRTAGASEVLMTIQPSDDCYHKDAFQYIQTVFKEKQGIQAVGFTRGFIANLQTFDIAEYNPQTLPPFFTIRFPREIFIDPFRHAEYTGPYKSHEYVGDKLRFFELLWRGFLVGTHGENTSTVFNHPYRGEPVSKLVLNSFGIIGEPLKLELSLRKAILRRLPQPIQRKIRFMFGEKIWSKIYDYLRN